MIPEKDMEHIKLMCDEDELLTLIDGAKFLVEMWNPINPAGEKWQKEWLKKARKVLDK